MVFKVLVVEDDAPTLQLMTEVLTSLKAEPDALIDSEQAAVVVNQRRYDAIFVDLQMPKVDGFELSRRIRQSSWNQTTPIIVVTGQDDPETMPKAFAAGATFFLQKPIDRQRLTMLLKAAQGKMIENRRRFVRVPLRTEVRCQVGQQNFTGTSVNLSQGGILVELGRILAPGTSVRLSFRLPGTQPMIEATGVVARADEKLRIGVRFTQMASRDIQLIRDLISNEDAEIAEATQRGSI